jgi:heme/copper-type cytochrome/quinol oxidase subunit 3
MTQLIENHAGTPDSHEAIHLPNPSYWPMVFGAGFMLVAFGIIFGQATAIPLTESFTLGYPLAWLGLVVMLVAVGGWLWSNIRERVHPTETPVVAAKFAMWCFLGTETIIFGALIGRVLALWVAEPEASALLTEPITSLLLVSLNTFLLLVSSLCVVLGLDSIQHGNARRLAMWIGLTALLGAAFVGVQAYEYSKLMHEGLKFGESQFASAFYFLTGNHGLHVIIGVIWATVVILRALRGGFTAQEHMGVEIFGLYWHFVDVVWIMIFTLVYLI